MSMMLVCLRVGRRVWTSRLGWDFWLACLGGEFSDDMSTRRDAYEW